MIKKYKFVSGESICIVDLGILRFGLYDRKPYFFQVRGFKVVTLRKLHPDLK